jgi:hypothetical protein
MPSIRDLDAVFEQDNVRPMPGYVICEKWTEISQVFVEGLGYISSKGFSPGGLLLASTKTVEQDNINATRVVVRRLGDSPPAWKFRCLSTGGSWNGPSPGKAIERDFHTDFPTQRIDVGTVLATRAVSGSEQDRASKFIALRYDEICAIGKPLEETDGFEMLPAPGWVLVQKDESKARAGALIHSYAGLDQMMADGCATWGTVLELPHGVNSNDLRVGDRVMFPSHAGVGATEYIEFGGGVRCLPLEDILLVQE